MYCVIRLRSANIIFAQMQVKSPRGRSSKTEPMDRMTPKSIRKSATPWAAEMRAASGRSQYVNAMLQSGSRPRMDSVNAASIITREAFSSKKPAV